MIARLALGLTLLLGATSQAQWDWSEDARHHQSIVKIITPGGDGSGVLISRGKSAKGGYEGKVLTAAHVVRNETSIKIAYFNGKRAKGCKLLKSNEDDDLAMIWVWVPESIEPVEIGSEVKHRDLLEITGFGMGTAVQDVRHFHGKASISTDKLKIFSDSVLLPGDSGGGVFCDGKLVGIVSGGWFWMRNGKQRVTWPARACNAGRLRAIVEAGLTANHVGEYP